jgi:tryptophan halogenase
MAASKSGDFFIDCTGFRALLIGKTLGVENVDWSNYLPCDRAIALQDREQGPIAAVHARHGAARGLELAHPRCSRRRPGLRVFQPVTSDAAAKAQLLRTLDAACIEEPRLIPYTTGHRRQFWKHNCMSLGLSSASSNRSRRPPIHLIARGVDFFLRLLPGPGLRPGAGARVQPAHDRRLRRGARFSSCCTTPPRRAKTRRSGSGAARFPCPTRCANASSCSAPTARCARARSRAVFRASSWQSVFEGMGIQPAVWHPRVENLDYAQIADSLKIRARRDRRHGGAPADTRGIPAERSG